MLVKTDSETDSAFFSFFFVVNVAGSNRTSRSAKVPVGRRGTSATSSAGHDDASGLRPGRVLQHERLVIPQLLLVPAALSLSLSLSLGPFALSHHLLAL